MIQQVDCLVRGAEQVVTCAGPIPKRKSAFSDIGLQPEAWIASMDGRIVYIGSEKNLLSHCRPTEDCVEIDASGMVVLPGFVDSHNHLPFAGSREEEFALRLKGATYQELTARGMGIQTSVSATRQVSLSELKSLCLNRLDTMLLHGTTTSEAKSGYGLNLKDEIKQLEAVRDAGAEHPIDLIPTFLGAHEVPREYKSRKEEYISLIIDRIIPEVRRLGLAEFFDIFCEEGVYSIEESGRLIRAAKAAGFKIKIHADEFVSLGGAQLAAEEGALSAEHLIAITEEGIARLAESETAAVLLPGVPFFLMQEQKPPARRLIDSGAIVALATDFNPGSSMTESMFFIFQLGVFTLGMNIEETLNAVTANGAYAVGRQQDTGSLEPGKKMDLIICEMPSYQFLAYHMGINPIRHVVKDGRLVVKDRRLVC
jgi:imidazolonepropionase